MNKSIQDIVETSFLYCDASLRSDMAKRIMYSLLPALSDKAQTYFTGGVVDYKALKAAAEGRHDIIKYGTTSCINELAHYVNNGPEFRNRARELSREGNYEAAIDIAINCFSDEENWAAFYGGKKWLNIATTIKKLIVLDKNLKNVRENKLNDPEAINKEPQILQQIVVELNIFDGLSHNTSEVMSNLIEEEVREYRKKFPSKTESTNILFGKEEKAIMRMMDAKELNNPMDVYKEIQQILKETGDLNRYKDWTDKFRSTEEYWKENPYLNKELGLIRFKKKLTPPMSELNELRDDLKDLINSYNSDTQRNLTDEANLKNKILENAIKIAEASERILKICRGHLQTPDIISIIDNYSIIVARLKVSIKKIYNTTVASWEEKIDDKKYLDSVLEILANTNTALAYIQSIF